MTRVLFIFLFTLTMGLSVFGQDSVVVAVQLNGGMDDDPIQNVNAIIEYNGQNFRKKSSMKGQFFFEAPRGVEVTFKFSHSQVISKEVTRRISNRLRGDTIQFTFDLEYIKAQEVEAMVVKAPGKIDTVFHSSRLHVSDFEVQPDGDILLLVYPKRLKKGSELMLIDYLGKVESQFHVPGRATELVRDYRGNPHVICEDAVYGVHDGERTIGISSLEKDYYLKYLAPILDTNQSRLYFSNFNPDYPAFDYFSYDRLDSTYKQIMSIEDELMMELYRSEYKWADVRTKLWAKNKELNTGIDAEIWVGANYFTQSIYYKEVYAPLFHRNDSLFVFDYYKDKLYTYDKLGEPLDSVSIYHHYNPKRTGWQKQLIQDRKTGQIYALFDRSGFTYLGRVDTKTGEITEHVKLEHRYVDKVAVHSNQVYYVYRPFESMQKKYLYRVGLPYKFGNAFTPEGDAVSIEE